MNWLATLLRVYRREFRLVFSDVGVMLFFFFLTIAYPLVYTIIYNPETLTDLPFVVVDHDRSEQSRNLVRMLDATQGMKVYDYAPDLPAARDILNSHDAFAVLEIPSDYGNRLGRGEQGVATFYSDMSLLLRYRTFLTCLTDVQLAAGAQIQQQTLDDLGLIGQNIGGAPTGSEAYWLGDPTQGFASFIIPGILVLILQQSMLLGTTMLAAGGSERRRRNGGVDPLAVPAGSITTVVGKVLCYVTLYLPVCVFVLFIVPRIFALPHIGELTDYMLFILPLLIASGCLGITLSVFVKERESSMLVLVFTSVVFLFLSGLTWPRYAMNGFWKLVGDAIPATWGVEGFIRLNSNGALLSANSQPYLMLWLLAGIYMITAVLTTRSLYPTPRKS